MRTNLQSICDNVLRGYVRAAASNMQANSNTETNSNLIPALSEEGDKIISLLCMNDIVLGAASLGRILIISCRSGLMLVSLCKTLGATTSSELTSLAETYMALASLSSIARACVDICQSLSPGKKHNFRLFECNRLDPINRGF
jgi:hypothetical protein